MPGSQRKKRRGSEVSAEPAKKLRRSATQGKVRIPKMINGRDGKKMKFTQSDETLFARVVLVHEPSLSNWMGSIHPAGSLYEEPVDVEAARAEHKAFQNELKKSGCEVHTIHSVLIANCDTDIRARIALEDLARESISYVLAQTSQNSSLTEEDRYLLSEEYKRKCVEKMGVEQLADAVLTRPTIHLAKADKNNAVLAVDYTFEPLVNLVFTRDQLITTRKGVVLTRLSSPIRQRETLVVKFCLEKLGIPYVGQIPAPGTMEGGEFYPAGHDLCFIGSGHRTNSAAVHYLLEKDLWGTSRVAVVKDLFDHDQQRMHLDTVCNICGPKVMIILEDILGETSPLRRLVDEYAKDSTGKYYLRRHDVEFGKYLEEEGWRLIRLTDEDQRNYGCNGLNLGAHFLAVDDATAKKTARSPYFGDHSLKVLDFRNMTAMYGSLHCCSQVLARTQRPAPVKESEHSSGFEQGLTSQYTEILSHLRKLTAAPIPSSEDMTEVETFDEDYGPRMPAFSAEYPFASPDIPRRQAASQVMMIAPTSYTPIDGLSPDAIKDKGEVLPQRELRELVLKEYGNFHMVVSVEAKVEAFLFSHEAYMGTPEAVFVGDWLSTHSPSETGGKPQMVVYAMEQRQRRNEVRADLLHFLHDRYSPAVILGDVSKVEAAFQPDEEMARPIPTVTEMISEAAKGNIEFFRTLMLHNVPVDVQDYDRRTPLHLAASEGHTELAELLFRDVGTLPKDRWGNTPRDDAVRGGHSAIVQLFDRALPKAEALEKGTLVLDRLHKVAYICRHVWTEELVSKWQSGLNYEMIVVDAQPGIKRFQRCLFIGTKFVVFAEETVVTKADRAKILKNLEKTGREIIRVTREQVDSFCTSIVEVVNRDGEPVLIMSTRAYNAFTEDQLAAMQQYCTIHHAPLDLLEDYSQGSASAVIAPLF